jgi:hypothetical protein
MNLKKQVKVSTGFPVPLSRSRSLAKASRTLRRRRSTSFFKANAMHEVDSGRAEKYYNEILQKKAINWHTHTYREREERELVTRASWPDLESPVDSQQARRRA